MSYRRRATERLDRLAAGDQIADPEAGTVRVASRWKEPEAPRHMCGEGVEARDPKPRKNRVTVDTGEPAPLLMRLSRKKTTLDVVSVVRA